MEGVEGVGGVGVDGVGVEGGEDIICEGSYASATALRKLLLI